MILTYALAHTQKLSLTLWMLTKTEISIDRWLLRLEAYVTSYIGYSQNFQASKIAHRVWDSAAQAIVEQQPTHGACYRNVSTMVSFIG